MFDFFFLSNLFPSIPLFILFYFLIWYNNFIINIKLLIKSDVDSNFKFQFNQIFPHLSCSSFNIFLSLSLFLALNLFVLYYLLGFFYIFEYYCLICVLHIIISVNLLLPITSTNFIRIRITKVCFISYYLFSSFIKQQIMIFMPKMTSIKCHCTVQLQINIWIRDCVSKFCCSTKFV